MQVEENSSKLGTQNEYFGNVFQSMKDMTEFKRDLAKIQLALAEWMNASIIDRLF
ncbi:MAG: hypothetical protein II992_06565 [Lachnospiraceae bacterium]|nr:hypothetical protein [Lachnospiraceae bacterium]